MFGRRSSENAVVLTDWPQPNAGVPEPMTIADDRSLFIRYRAQSDRFVVVHFPLCHAFTFGAPNDEALGGHPLRGRGLQFYSVHRVEGSSWLSLLEQRNSVHPNHNKRRFLDGMTHYVFTFHDSTLECAVVEGEFWKHSISEFDNEIDADRHIHDKRTQ
jgi:hypothetical protein